MTRKKKTTLPSPALDFEAMLDDLIHIVGDTPPLQVIPTGVWSFDKASGGGWPLGVMTETSGKWGVGKSTWVQYVAGVLARSRGAIVMNNFEPFDPKAMQRNIYPSGFQGDVIMIPETKSEKKGVVRLTGEERLDMFMDAMTSESNVVGVLDAVGSIVPSSESEEDSIDEAHVGVLARLMSKFARRTSHILRTKEILSNILLVNHEYALIGPRGGSETPGGRKIKYLSGLRMRLWIKDKFDEGSLLVQGELDRVKFARSGNDFRFVILAGRGVHPGLSAVQECLHLKLASVEGGRVNLGGKNYGYFKKMLEEGWVDDDLFVPFKAALEEG